MSNIKPIGPQWFDPEYWDKMVLLYELLVYGTDYDEVPIEDINRPRYSHLREKLNQAFERMVVIERKVNGGAEL